MTDKILTKHHLEFLSLKGGCRGSSESTLFKMPHCWKSHVAAQILSLSYTVTIQAPIHHDSSRFETDGKIGVHRDVSGWKKRNSSINTMFHDAPMVSARFINGSTTTHDGSATIHYGGATKAHDASTIRYGASTIQAGSATVASRPPTNVQDLEVVARLS